MQRSSCVLAAAAALALACGGGASGPTVVQPPVTTLAPQPSPTPSPSPTASPCEHGSCGNNTTVARATLALYLLLDDQGRLVEPTPDPVRQVLEEPIPVGYTMRLDVTGRDAAGNETDGRGQIEWVYSGDDLIHTNRRSAWTRDITVAKPGTWSVYVVFDGVSSNSITFTFAPAQ
jgi:hypothetical protein